MRLRRSADALSIVAGGGVGDGGHHANGTVGRRESRPASAVTGRGSGPSTRSLRPRERRSDGATADVADNTIGASAAAGVWVQVGSTGIVHGNTLAGTTGHGLVGIGGSQIDVVDNTISDVVAAPGTGTADGVVIAGGSSARVADNLFPIPGGFTPDPLRACVLVDGAALPRTALPWLMEGQAVIISGNVVEQAMLGVVIQGASEDAAVDVGDNDLAGADTPTSVDLGLLAPADPQSALVETFPIPGGFLEL